jgi:hypothetical protein
MKRNRSDSEDEDDGETEFEPRVAIITADSEEREYRRVLQLEEDVSLSLKYYTICIKARRGLSRSNVEFTHICSREFETVERHFIKMWHNMFDYPDTINSMVLPDKLLRKITCAYSDIQGSHFDLHQLLKKLDWGKVPYWLVRAFKNIICEAKWRQGSVTYGLKIKKNKNLVNLSLDGEIRAEIRRRLTSLGFPRDVASIVLRF